MQRNSFDSLRLLGSLVVFIGHAYIITGSLPPSVGTIPIHSFGVCIFFAISGFLIAQSWSSDGNWRRYLTRRLLRIEPALIIVVAVTALLIGGLATTEPAGIYYRHGWTWRYILCNSALITVWGLPGVFDNAPIPGQANGSLWTLPIEFSLYLVTPILVFVGKQHRVVGPLSIILLGLVIYYLDKKVVGLSTFNLLGVDVGKGIALIPYFWIGVALRLSGASEWSAIVKTAVLRLSAGVVVIWALIALPTLLPVGIVAITCFVVMLGVKDLLYSRNLRRVGDLSYGIYLWSFPIQQFAFAKLGGGPFFNIAVTAPAVLIAAYCSWHLIERQALRFKPSRRRHHVK